MITSIARFRGRSTPLIIAAGLLVGTVSLVAMARGGPQFTSVSANHTVSIQINDLRPGDVRFFKYGDRADDQIGFLLARDNTGRIKATLDACERCYMYHQGYASSHGSLICRFCGNRYRLESMESGLASCVPMKLPFRITGQTVIIKSVDLEHARGMF